LLWPLADVSATNRWWWEQPREGAKRSQNSRQGCDRAPQSKKAAAGIFTGGQVV
jgi:hypothetical protein